MGSNFETLRYTLVSSANILMDEVTVSGMSLMYVRNRSGPRTGPCDTPLVTGAVTTVSDNR